MTTLFDLEFQFSKLLSVNISANTFIVISEGIMVPTLTRIFFREISCQKEKSFALCCLNVNKFLMIFFGG